MGADNTFGETNFNPLNVDFPAPIGSPGHQSDVETKKNWDEFYKEKDRQMMFGKHNCPISLKPCPYKTPCGVKTHLGEGAWYCIDEDKAQREFINQLQK